MLGWPPEGGTDVSVRLGTKPKNAERAVASAHPNTAPIQWPVFEPRWRNLFLLHGLKVHSLVGMAIDSLLAGACDASSRSKLHPYNPVSCPSENRIRMA